jgi:hypothetical protein
MTKQQHREVIDSIAAVRGDVATMAVNVKNRFDGIDGHLERVDGRLDTIDGRLDAFDGQFTAVKGRLAGLEKKIDAGHDTIIAHIDRVYVELSGRLGDVEQPRTAKAARAGRRTR